MELCADITRQHTVTVSWDVCVLTVLHMLGFSDWFGVFCFCFFRGDEVQGGLKLSRHLIPAPTSQDLKL